MPPMSPTHLKLLAQAVQLPLPSLRGLLEPGGQQAVEDAKETSQRAAHCRHLLLAACSVASRAGRWSTDVNSTPPMPHFP